MDVVQKRLWCISLSFHAFLKEHEQFCCSLRKAEAALLIGLHILELAYERGRITHGARDGFEAC
jgi:hypothetical protein